MPEETLKKPVTVLVVDDEPAVRRMITAALTSCSYRVVEAASGAAALAALRQDKQHIDLVVSDIVMQGADGVSLFQQVSAEFAALPFVFMTGFAGNERLIHLPSHYPVLTKPFTPSALLACVEHVLESA